ncbi:MAG TPA: alpha-amylase family glycosyl hydrolase [Ignavibacteriaceae bacterium]|nr:alpha-amylase family glycosyl hydrolase [Ignavibacteriaceae bacterium]
MKIRNFTRIVFPLLLASLLVLPKVKAQNISDLIKTINLTSGKTDSVLISDLFYADKYEDLKFSSSNSIKVKFNYDNTKLLLMTDKDFEGMTLIGFSFNNKHYQIPVRINKDQILKFIFKPGEKYEKVFLFGSFNSWNRSELEMKNENGVYSISIPLEPGRYQYKYFADGKELIDPANPDKIPNGMGDYNSVLTVETKHKAVPFLFINGSDLSKDKSTFSFIYENKETEEKLSITNIIPLLNNNLIPSENITLANNKIDISLPLSELKGKNILRLAVTQNGQSTNVQTIILFDGKPAGSEKKHFTWHDAIIYSTLIDRFNDGDKTLNKPIKQDSLFDKANYMGGDFQGLINKFNDGYFDSIGINTLWISPVYDNTNHAFREFPKPHRWFSGYHGYWPVKPRSVEEEFGTMQKLKELIETAHKHNVKVLLDIVAHHVHQEHPYFKEHRDWFGHLELPDGRLNLRIWDEYRLTTWFEPFMPTFDFIDSQAAVDAVTDDSIWWLMQTGADGFRQDAVKHIPNNFWRALNRKLKKEVEIPQNKEVFQMGETFGSYELVKSYVNNGQLPAQFNFNLYDVAIPTFLNPSSSFKNLDKEIKKGLNIFGENNLMGNIMDSQDKDRFMAYADGDLKINDGNSIEIGWNNPPSVDNPDSYKKERLYLSYLLTIPGIPTIYYGDEIGMTGAADPDNRRMMRFENQLNENENENFVAVSELIHLRKDHSALRYGDYFSLIADTNVFAYLRSDMNERILVLLNKNQDEQEANLDFPIYFGVTNLTDLLSGENFRIKDNKITIPVNGIGYRFFKLEHK